MNTPTTIPKEHTMTTTDPTPTTIQKRWLKVSDAAQYLSLSVNTIRNLCYTRRIPFHKRKGIVRFDIHELDRWMEEAKHEVQAV